MTINLQPEATTKDIPRIGKYSLTTRQTQGLMKNSITALAAICMASAASAQFYTPTGQPIPNVTSVTNEGVAVGYNDQNQPFYIWDAVNDTQTLIGGISAGQGVGGVPRFDEAGKLIAAPMESDRINVFTEWSSNTNQDMAPYVFRRTYYVGDWDLFAVGYTPDEKEGIIVKSANVGQMWKRADILARQNADGKWENYTPDFPVYCIAQTMESKGIMLVGGGNGTLLTGSGNGSWNKTELPDVSLPSPVKAYRDMSFTYITTERGYKDADQGCMLLELENGLYAIIYTLDGTETFSIAEGFSDKPVAIANNGSDFFLGTSDGTIQVSRDGGKTWSDIFTDTEGRPFHRIVFADESKGVALSDNVVFITRDGGETWTLTEVFSSSIGIGFPQTSSWKDAVWCDDSLVIVGTNASCYRSTDDGATFSKVDGGFVGDLGTVFRDSRKITSVIGQEGMTWRKEDKEFISGYTAGLYDIEADVWTPLASTGYVSESASSPWQISGDGRHVVGIAYGLNSAQNKVPHAAVWTGTDEVTLLPNRFADGGTFDEAGGTRACRANAVSYDGSVVAGWQDVWGPWYGSVWRKGSDGNYTQQILTVNPEKGQDDIDWSDKNDIGANLVGSCQCITPDGKWIGGRGIPELNGISGAWIYSEEEGFKVLYEDMDATTSDINSDGTVAVGWTGPGAGAWIWTKENGRTSLQEYVEQRIGHSLGDFGIVSVYDMSPNGRYVCGYGMYGDMPMAYVFDLLHSSGIEEMEAAQVKAAVYPNPASEEIHVDLPFDSTELNTSITLVSLNGQVVRQLDTPNPSNVIDIRDLSRGIYVLDVNANGRHKAFKVIVK